MTCSVSNKSVYALLLIGALLWPCSGVAVEYGSVSVVASGKDLSEAMRNALRQAVASSLQKDKSLDKGVLKSILEHELSDFTAHFVSAYKILETGAGGFMNISATVETDVIKALASIVPKNFAAEKNAKALVSVEADGLPDPMLAEPLAKAMENIVKERMARRKFHVITAAELADAPSFGDEITTQEVLKPLGDKANAVVSIGIKLHHATIQNENTHAVEDRLSVNAIVLDNKKNKVLHRFNGFLLMPKPSKKDALAAEWTRELSEEGGAIFQNILIKAGELFLEGDVAKDGVLLRIISPPNFSAISALRLGIESIKGVKSLVETSVRKGAYDILVRSPLGRAALQQKILALELEGLLVQEAKEGGDPEAMILLEIKEKQAEIPAPKEETSHEE